MGILIVLQSIWALALVPAVCSLNTTLAEVDSVTKADMHYSFARQYHRNKQYDDAITQYRKSLKYDPHNIRAHYYLGSIYYSNKADTASATAEYLRTVALDSTYVNAYRMLSRIYYAKADYDSTIVIFERLAALEPETPEFRHRLVHLYVYKGDHEKAVPHAEKLSELIPDDEEILTQLGDSYLKSGRKRDARTAYERVLLSRPEDIRLLRLLIQLERDARDEPKMLEHSKALARVDSMNYQLFTKIAELAQKLDRTDDFEAALKRMVQIRSADAFPVGHLAEFYFNAGRLKKARRWIDRGLKLAPEDGRLLVLSGEYYLKEGHKDEALEQFTAALVDPAWKSHAQQMIWSIKPPLSEEEKRKRDFFSRGKGRKEDTGGDTEQ